MNSLNRFSDPMYCLLRFLVGLLFACHGAQKMLGMFGGQGVAQGKMLIMGIVELGGLLIAIGLFTRVFAFLASGGMAWAYFSVHFAGKAIKHPPPITPAEHFFPILNGGEPAVLFCLVFLFIFFYGAGRWSLDALIWGRSASPSAAAAV
jgi:putative oxidoreductase